MKALVSIVLAVTIVSGAFAYSDLGLLNSRKTISYFLLMPSDATGLSSGMVYSKKQNDRMAIEASWTAYKSAYLITQNVTKIRMDGKYKVAEFGPVGLTGLAGAALYYAPSVGAGLAGDVGGILSVRVFEGLALALSLNSIIFRDGLEVNVEPYVNYVPGFLSNLEVYAGGRIEGSMVGYSFDGSQGGKFGFYANLGIRVGI